MAQEAISIISSAVIVRPTEFTFASPTQVTATVSQQNSTSFDIKLKHLCDHRLSSGQYKLESCPRCLGTGYYYDVKFNDVGKLFEVTVEDKLQQALEKLALTEENKFHSEVAMGLQKWLGALGNRANLGVIKDNIVGAVASLQEIQKTVNNLAAQSRILTINSIDINFDTLTSLRYTIQLTTVSGGKKTISGTITLSELNA